MPFIYGSSSSKCASLERPQGHQPHLGVAKDDSYLPGSDMIQPTRGDDFIVASENLQRRRNLLPPEGAVSHADSVARQLAAEELAETLGLDNDERLISVISQPSGKSIFVFAP